jgi:hypothetical protein
MFYCALISNYPVAAVAARLLQLSSPPRLPVCMSMNSSLFSGLIAAAVIIIGGIALITYTAPNTAPVAATTTP